MEKNLAVTSELNKKYANKVVQNVGLCISVFDILEASEGFIYHSDGASYYKVKFRIIVFRPYIGEVLTGKIKSSTEKGIKVSMGFFDDIFIPADFMQPGTQFVNEDQVFLWNVDGAEFWMDLNQTIRFRVQAEAFEDVTPRRANTGPRRASLLEASSTETPKIAPYSLTCSVNEDGLGVTSWWKM
ncbi:hypothetical protein BZG36_02495 [Bifiguratus adelaidae]|uniref:DNA-directed RNA polymerase III subunit RPC8 n=1 Tax=Bifiguratus adelaidae TaxID=1938954 RepID=A0A261Y2R6_9FUNG|nr:hypothetical protein BZG36_02495 [Bifiguratus adelaidae]